jgi:hypothetical protein
VWRHGGTAPLWRETLVLMPQVLRVSRAGCRRNQDHETSVRQCPESSVVVECRGTGTDLHLYLGSAQARDARRARHGTADCHAILTRVRKHGERRRLPRFVLEDKWGANAVADQDKIGWCNFLIGRVSRNWSDSQQRFADSLRELGPTLDLGGYSKKALWMCLGYVRQG